MLIDNFDDFATKQVLNEINRLKDEYDFVEIKEVTKSKTKSDDTLLRNKTSYYKTTLTLEFHKYWE